MDMLNSRAAARTGPPQLPPNLREHLLRGLRADLDRDRHRLAMTVHVNGRGAAMLRDRIAHTVATLAEMGAL